VRLANKAALITGAASGIGLGIATLFAQEGAAVILVDRDTERGESAAQTLTSQGLRASFIHADLALPDDITSAISTATNFAGGLDIVVNNAAAFLPKPIHEITVPEWDRLMAVNLRAPFLLVQAALPTLRERHGNVLNISSTAAIKVFSPNLPYAAAKAGLITMTKSMAQELRPDRIRVNCICPGAVDTPALHTDIAVRGAAPDTIEYLYAQGLLTTPAQIAALALHIVSDEGAALNGSIIVADAGALLS
jgi:NAD(P)-dependent dehydrogenase (short-subunit alcohol dehydrogenase family)